MHRIDTPGNVGGLFVPPNPITGQAAVVVDSNWLNDIQENIMAVLAAAAVAATKGDASDLANAIIALIASHAPALPAVVDSFNGRTGVVALTSADVDPLLPVAVASFNGRTGVVALTAADVDPLLPVAVASFNGRTGAVALTAADVDPLLPAQTLATHGGSAAIAFPDAAAAAGTVGASGWRKDTDGWITQWAYIQLEDTADATPSAWDFPVAFAVGPLVYRATNCSIAAGQSGGNARNAVCDLASTSAAGASFTLFQTNVVGTLAIFLVEVSGF